MSKRVLIAVLALALVGLPMVASALADGPTDACGGSVGMVPEAGPRGCRSADAVVHGTAAFCRNAGGSPDACATADGRVVSEDKVAAYERSWAHRALGLQRALDDAVPLVETLTPHTHNSFNSSWYSPTVTNQDPNQVYSLRDQLRMDMRAIELDVHPMPSPSGTQVVLCHGEPVPAGPVTVHAGCSIDRPLADGLAELRAWLDEPANQREVLVLYLENNLDGDKEAHDLAAAAIQKELGPLVLPTPPGQPCAPMPYTASRAAIRAGGHRVLIVGNCGPGAWGTWVHERGPLWDESSSPPGDDYPENCDSERVKNRYDGRWIRRYEDSTWLSAMAGAGGSVTLTETRRMVRCGVTMPGFDQLTPDDPRLPALVWSWAENEPRAGAGDCASQGTDGRFRATDCGSRLPAACLDATGGWHVTATAVPFRAAAAACRAAVSGGSFAVPWNGWRNEQLRRTHAGGTPVWVNVRL